MSQVFDVFDVFRLLLYQLVPVFDVFRRFPEKSHVFDVFGVFTCLGIFLSTKCAMCLTCLRVGEFFLQKMSHVLGMFRLLLDHFN